MWHIHIVEYYLTIKRDDVLIHATVWRNPEDAMLSERSHTKHHTLCDSIDRKCPEEISEQRQKADGWLWRPGGGVGAGLLSGFMQILWN